MNKFNWLDEYLLSKKGAQKDFKVEWQWQRYLVGGKMFAAICKPDEKYKPYNGRELINLKCEPLMAEFLRKEYVDIIAGFYMDKNNWNSVYLDDNVPENVLRDLCDKSYDLVFSKLTKKMQREIAG